MIKFLDLKVSDSEYDLLSKVFQRVCNHGQLVMGIELEDFEKKLANYVGRKYAIGVSSGTDAVYLALRALELKPGDEVITSSLSWIATANSIYRAGGTPVFCDIGEDLNIDPTSIKSLISNKTKAIVSVDFTGKLCDYDSLIKICEYNNISLIQDGSQAFGAKRGNFISGSVGLISAISHNPMKVFGALGEAGSVLTDNYEIADKIKILRYNGTINKEICITPSLNGRMDSLQAAILSVRLDNFQSVINNRLKNYEQYKRELITSNNDIILPNIEKNEIHSLYTFTIQCKQRDKLVNFLNENSIENKIQHPILMCDQEPYKKFKNNATNARKLINNILSIPIHEKLTDKEISYVSNKINEFYGH